MAKKKLKKWYQSKTIWAGIATMITGLGMYFTGEQSLQELITAFVGVVFTILRVVTKEEISVK